VCCWGAGDGLGMEIITLEKRTPSAQTEVTQTESLSVTDFPASAWEV